MFFEVVIIFIVLVSFLYLFSVEKYKSGNINQWSYQRYAKFFGMNTFTENDFDKKIKKIEHLINIENERELKEIAKKSNCYYEECILKIRYLMNKRRIKKMYIDTKNKLLALVGSWMVAKNLTKSIISFLFNKTLFWASSEA